MSLSPTRVFTTRVFTTRVFTTRVSPRARVSRLHIMLGAMLVAMLLVGCAGTGGDADSTADDAASDQDTVTDEEAGSDEAGADAADGEEADDATDGDDPADGAADGAADGEQVELVLVTHDSFNVSTGILEAFTDETGIEVVLAPLGDAGTMVNTAILTRDNPQGDVLFGVDNTFLSRALDAELFVPYRSEQLEHVDDAFVADPEHRVTPVDFGDVCLNYDRAWFDERGLAVPTDLAELTDEVYRGLLAVQNPATSSPGLAFLLATVQRFGEDGYLDFWSALRDNDVVVTDGWSQAYYDEFSATGVGERPLVVSYASSPPAEVFFADPQPDEAPTGVIEASCFRQIEFAGILDGTPHLDAAEAFIDFLLSETFQADLALTMFVFPVRDDVVLPEVFVEHAVIPDQPLELEPDVIGEGREEWIEQWTSVVLR